MPTFIRQAERTATAEALARALNGTSAQTLRDRLLERAGRRELLWRSGFWDQPIEKTDIERIGKR